MEGALRNRIAMTLPPGIVMLTSGKLFPREASVLFLAAVFSRQTWFDHPG